jgi:hypothetical protein
MTQELFATMMATLHESIARVEQSVGAHPDNRALARMLAHLWSAHDELALCRDTTRRQP